MRRIQFGPILLSALFLGLAACGSGSSSGSDPGNLVMPPSPGSGESPCAVGEVAYDYTGSTGGLVVVRGTLVLDFPTAPEDLREWGGISGRWDLDIVRPMPYLGELQGTGRIEAGLDADNVLTVSMHPGWADNNVYLVGTFDETGTLAGSWSSVGIAGPLRTGEFVANPR